MPFNKKLRNSGSLSGCRAVEALFPEIAVEWISLLSIIMTAIPTMN
jgi:hypothetical protein